MIKNTAAHPNNGTLRGSATARVLDTYSGMDESPKHYAELKKSDTKAYTLCDAAAILF